MTSETTRVLLKKITAGLCINWVGLANRVTDCLQLTERFLTPIWKEFANFPKTKTSGIRAGARMRSTSSGLCVTVGNACKSGSDSARCGAHGLRPRAPIGPIHV